MESQCFIKYSLTVQMEEGGNIAKSPTYHTESSDVWVH